jgi:hypothetical protein
MSVGLAGAIVADDAKHLTFLKREVHVVQAR